jgi:hypothetical protein
MNASLRWRSSNSDNDLILVSRLLMNETSYLTTRVEEDRACEVFSMIKKRTSIGP